MMFDLRIVEKVVYKEQVQQFGLEIKRLREAKKISQQELAYRCDVDIRTIQRIEKGDYGVGLHNLFALAIALEVPPYQLLENIFF